MLAACCKPPEIWYATAKSTLLSCCTTCFHDWEWTGALFAVTHVPVHTVMPPMLQLLLLPLQLLMTITLILPLLLPLLLHLQYYWAGTSDPGSNIYEPSIVQHEPSALLCSSAFFKTLHAWTWDFLFSATSKQLDESYCQSYCLSYYILHTCMVQARLPYQAAWFLVTAFNLIGS